MKKFLPQIAVALVSSIIGGIVGTFAGPLPVTLGGTGAASTSQNYGFMGPTSGSGAPGFRALVAGDISGLSAGSTLTGEPDVIPSSPNSFDDEFNTSSLDGSWTSLTGTTSSVANGALMLRDGGANNRLTGVVKSISGSTWVVTAKVTHLWDYVTEINGSTTAKAYKMSGLVVRESATGKTVHWGFCNYSGGAAGSTGEVRILCFKFTGLGVNPGESEFGSQHLRPWIGLGNIITLPPPAYFRAERTATQMIYSVSLDGHDWYALSTRTTTTDFTTAPDVVGVGITSYASAHLATFDWIRKS